MNESGPENRCGICGGLHPTGECIEKPKVVIEYGQGEQTDFKEADSLEVFILALEQELRDRGLEIQLAQEGEGFFVFDLLKKGEVIGGIELVHEATAGTAGWAKAFTINFLSSEGEGLSKSTIGNPEELSRMIDEGIDTIREYNSRHGHG